MKNASKPFLLTIALVLASTFFALAYNPHSTDAASGVIQIKTTDKTAVIRVSNLPGHRHSVLRIRNQWGHILYREVITATDSHAKKYDFSALPDGEYIAELRTSAGITKQSFSLEEGTPTAVYFKPAIQTDTDVIKVTFVNSIDSSVTLRLYDPIGRKIYEEVVPSRQQFAKGLNVSRLSRGQYSLTVLGENYVYAKNIFIK